MLHDEHVWVDSSDESYHEKTWKAISKKIRSANMLLAHGNWFRAKIAGLLKISPDTISTVPFGVDPDKYFMSEPARISIGYISRLCRDMGVDALSEAYCRLLRGGVCRNTSSLEFCGGYTKDDAAIVRESRKKIARSGGQAHIRKHFDIDARADFLSSLTALSVPAREGVAFGGFIAEAMASGVPVVQPDIGGFSEVISETGAGVLYSPNTPEALADALEMVICDDDSRKRMAAAGRRAVAGKYNNTEMARQSIAFMRT